MRTALPAVLLALAATACGQKGALYLRDEPPPGYKPKPEVYKPVPYPPGSTERDRAPSK
jgi:predicted small lipoprotein YifL